MSSQATLELLLKMARLVPVEKIKIIKEGNSYKVPYCVRDLFREIRSRRHDARRVDTKSSLSETYLRRMLRTTGGFDASFYGNEIRLDGSATISRNNICFCDEGPFHKGDDRTTNEFGEVCSATVYKKAKYGGKTDVTMYVYRINNTNKWYAVKTKRGAITQLKKMFIETITARMA